MSSRRPGRDRKWRTRALPYRIRPRASEPRVSDAAIRQRPGQLGGSNSPCMLHTRRRSPTCHQAHTSCQSSAVRAMLRLSCGTRDSTQASRQLQPVVSRPTISPLYQSVEQPLGPLIPGYCRYHIDTNVLCLDLHTLSEVDLLGSNHAQ